MAERIVKYRQKNEVLEKAKEMCGKNFEDDWCEEYREAERYLREAKEILERQQRAEKEFLKLLEKFNPQNPEESFKKLWVSEKNV